MQRLILLKGLDTLYKTTIPLLAQIVSIEVYDLTKMTLQHIYDMFISETVKDEKQSED